MVHSGTVWLTCAAPPRPATPANLLPQQLQPWNARTRRESSLNVPRPTATSLNAATTTAGLRRRRACDDQTRPTVRADRRDDSCQQQCRRRNLTARVRCARSLPRRPLVSWFRRCPSVPASAQSLCPMPCSPIRWPGSRWTSPGRACESSGNSAPNQR